MPRTTACGPPRADSRIVAAWPCGSFAAGTADAYSDIDLNCAITDESADWFTAHWADLARQITPLVLAGPIPGALGGYVITPEWLHLDLLFHRRSACDPTALALAKPLFDRTGTLLPGRPVQAAEASKPVGSAGPVGSVRKHDGRKRLNRYLTASQLAFLESLPPLTASRNSVIGFDQLVAADLSARGRGLAERAGARWPADLEGATTAYLQRCLNVSLGPG